MNELDRTGKLKGSNDAYGSKAVVFVNTCLALNRILATGINNRFLFEINCTSAIYHAITAERFSATIQCVPLTTIVL